LLVSNHPPPLAPKQAEYEGGASRCGAQTEETLVVFFI
jgi:hypothetical protein